MSLHDHLALLDERARLALAVLDGEDALPLLESLGLEDTDETDEQVAEDYLNSGYAFTPAPGSATVAVLAVGGPEIHLARHQDGYVLTGYMPGHREAVRGSAAITAWGRLRDQETTGYICKRCGAPSPLGIGYASEAPANHPQPETVTACPCGYSQTL